MKKSKTKMDEFVDDLKKYFARTKVDIFGAKIQKSRVYNAMTTVDNLWLEKSNY